jgi:hypothetical protein
MPPQTDKLSILRAVLAQIAGRGGTPSPEGFDTPMRPTTQYPSPSGFDATMRGGYPPPALLSQTDPYYRSVQANTRAGDNFLPNVGDVADNGYVFTKADLDGGAYFNSTDRFGRTATAGGSARNPMPPRVQNPDVTGFDAAMRGQGVADRMPQGKPSKSGVKTISNKMESDMVTAPARQTNADVMGFDAALRGEGASDRVRPVQSSGKPAPKASTQASGKPASTGSQASPQQGKPSESGKSAPIAQAEPSGEALSYFRKNKTSAGWDALGTGVSLVQQSMKPEKGGLKSRAEYDRLLRGSDNFKKLEGNEQQRVRQAFAQWMNEQTIFKGKA